LEVPLWHHLPRKTSRSFLRWPCSHRLRWCVPLSLSLSLSLCFSFVVIIIFIILFGTNIMAGFSLCVIFIKGGFLFSASFHTLPLIILYYTNLCTSPFQLLILHYWVNFFSLSLYLVRSTSYLFAANVLTFSRDMKLCTLFQCLVTLFLSFSCRKLLFPTTNSLDSSFSS
jgi:hypothetical protein